MPKIFINEPNLVKIIVSELRRMQICGRMALKRQTLPCPK
jgi:hypothetical protein